MRIFVLNTTIVAAFFAASCAPIPEPDLPSPQSATPSDSADVPTPQNMAASDEPYDAIPTKVLDRDDLARLLNNSGITLQWIDWEKRGQLKAGNYDGEIWLSGTQFAGPDDSGALYLEGRVVEIGTGYFIYSGTITIEDTPDAGRVCTLIRDDWRFEVTQNRKYWRLRQFEWCDGLTDYVDIYS